MAYINIESGHEGPIESGDELDDSFVGGDSQDVGVEIWLSFSHFALAAAETVAGRSFGFHAVGLLFLVLAEGGRYMGGS